MRSRLEVLSLSFTLLPCSKVTGRNIPIVGSRFSSNLYSKQSAFPMRFRKVTELSGTVGGFEAKQPIPVASVGTFVANLSEGFHQGWSQ